MALFCTRTTGQILGLLLGKRGGKALHESRRHILSAQTDPVMSWQAGKPRLKSTSQLLTMLHSEKCEYEGLTALLIVGHGRTVPCERDTMARPKSATMSLTLASRGGKSECPSASVQRSGWSRSLCGAVVYISCKKLYKFRLPHALVGLVSVSNGWRCLFSYGVYCAVAVEYFGRGVASFSSCSLASCSGKLRDSPGLGHSSSSSSCLSTLSSSFSPICWAQP